MTAEGNGMPIDQPKELALSVSPASWAGNLVDSVRNPSRVGLTQSRLARVQLWMALTAAALAPVPFGSVSLFWTTFWVGFLAVTLLLQPPRPHTNSQRLYLSLLIVVTGLYAAVAIVQVSPTAIADAHPIWETLKAAGFEVSPHPSAQASIPDDAVGRALLGLLALYVGFAVGVDAHGVNRLTRGIARCGAVGATYAILSHLFAPNALLWREKTAYLGDVTGTFVNRNTAAAYFGCCFVLWIGIVARRFSSLKVASAAEFLTVGASGFRRARLLGSSSAAAICLAALFGTNSRAGIVVTLASAAFAVFLMNGRSRGLARSRLVGVAAALTATVISAGLVARVASEGLFDQLRWSAYRSSVALVSEHWTLGTGLGTFVDVFPAVRRPDTPIINVWDKAHSTVLEIAVEMGVPVAALVALGSLCGLYVVAARARAAGSYTLASMAAALSLFLAHSIVDFPLQIPGTLLLFGLLFGAALARAGECSTVLARARSQATNRLRCAKMGWHLNTRARAPSKLS
jgi:hypothetical protein